MTRWLPIALAVFMVLGGLTAISTAAQESTPPPAAGSDPFDPVVPEATPIAGVETFEVASADHTTEPVDYPQDPPAGGPHHPAWQMCRVYDAPIINEHAVHSQEHGAVWITYQPDLADDARAAVEQLAEDQPYVLVSPYPELDSPVVASAWGAQLRVEDASDPRLQAFIERYAGQGPEPGATCISGVETTVEE